MTEYVANFLFWFTTIILAYVGAINLLLAMVPGCTVVNALAIITAASACAMYYAPRVVAS